MSMFPEVVLTIDNEPGVGDTGIGLLIPRIGKMTGLDLWVGEDDTVVNNIDWVY